MRSLTRRLAAAVGLGLAAIAPLALTVPAQAATVYQDSSVQIFDNPIPLQHIDAITAIDAEASWNTTIASPCPTTTSPLGSALTVVPVPSHMCVQFSKTGGGTPTWTIASESNIPAAALISLNPVSGLLTVTPTSTPVIAANNQNITLVVKVTDGSAVAFETLTAQPIILAGGVISAIDVTAVTDSVTLAGSNDNTTGRVFFAPAPAGVTFTGANLPGGTGGRAGVTLTGNVLSATSTVPGVYNDIAVTATDAAGATAVDTFDVLVKGGRTSSNLPRLSGGHAFDPFLNNKSREDVDVILSGQPACLHFTIVGPGPINGHQGWVPGHLGLNEAVYGGLAAGHGNTVYYQPVTQNADGSPTGNSSCAGAPTTPISGTHWGYVYFIAGQ